MNYKKWLLNGLILCLVSPCFGAQDVQLGWQNHKAPEDLEVGQWYNSKTLHLGASVRNIALSPDDRLLGVGGLKSLAIIDMKTGRNIYNSRKEVNVDAWMHKVPFFVSALGYDIGIVDPLSGGMVQRSKNYQFSRINKIVISFDDRMLVSLCWDNTVKVLDMGLEKCVQTSQCHDKEVNSLVMSSDDRTIIVTGSWDNTVEIWDIRSGEWVKTLEGHDGLVNSIAISLDGKTVVSGSSDKTIKLWDVRLGKCIHTLQGHGNWVNSVISSDDKIIVSGSYDGTVKIWDVNSGECTQTLEDHNSCVMSVAMSSDNRKIFSGSSDNTVKVWEQKK